jgi:hypothetical protein
MGAAASVETTMEAAGLSDYKELAKEKGIDKESAKALDESALCSMGMENYAHRAKALAVINAEGKKYEIERCHLKQLPDVLDNSVYVHEKWPLVIDPNGDAQRFLTYQRGAVLQVGWSRRQRPPP